MCKTLVLVACESKESQAGRITMKAVVPSLSVYSLYGADSGNNMND